MTSATGTCEAIEDIAEKLEEAYENEEIEDAGEVRVIDSDIPVPSDESDIETSDKSLDELDDESQGDGDPGIDDDPEILIPFGLDNPEGAKTGVMEISHEELGRFEDGERAETPDMENAGWGKEPHHSWDLSTTAIGKEGEKLAAAYLTQQGYEVVKTNEWFANNEVDIIAFDPNENEYVLVEVKTRVDLGNDQVIPEISVTRDKQRRYRNAALLYLATRDLSHVRFDVIAINIVAERHARLRHLVGAYCFDY